MEKSSPKRTAKKEAKKDIYASIANETDSLIALRIEQAVLEAKAQACKGYILDRVGDKLSDITERKAEDMGNGVTLWFCPPLEYEYTNKKKILEYLASHSLLEEAISKRIVKIDYNPSITVLLSSNEKTAIASKSADELSHMGLAEMPLPELCKTYMELNKKCDKYSENVKTKNKEFIESAMQKIDIGFGELPKYRSVDHTGNSISFTVRESHQIDVSMLPLIIPDKDAHILEPDKRCGHAPYICVRETKAPEIEIDESSQLEENIER